ncbi:MAG TPA: SusD/RagB family nutrient-binding outer membrane lipoprotein, partial [Flavisolibacter sp.]
MKKNIIKAGLVCLMVVSGFSCSKNIDSAYQNPNADVRVPPEELLPQIISAMAGNYGGHGTMNDIRYVGQYVQNFSFYLTQGNFDRMGYNNTVGDVAQSTWRMHYYDIGQNNQRMIQWATEEEKWDYAGVGKAIEAWSWLILTDYYDNVILDEAFNTSKITFSYNTQPQVYEHVKKLCGEALELLNRTGGNSNQANLAKGDAYMFNGDVTKWKKFTNGVLARVYNRYSNKGALYKPDSVIHYANLAMLENSDNALIKFQATTVSATHNFFGPLRGNLTGITTANPTAIRQGQYIANLLNGTNSAFSGVQDPRAIYLLRLNTNGTFRGVPPVLGQASLPAADRPENFWGVSQNPDASNATTPAGQGPRFIFRNDAPFPIMTASEMHFLKAEAAFRKGDKGTALTAYKEGINKHFDLLTTTYNVNIPAGMAITTASRDLYLASPAVTPPSAEALTLSKIMLQK